MNSALSREGEASNKSRKMPTKPSFKKKLGNRTETSALSTHNQVQEVYNRESQNNSQIS